MKKITLLLTMLFTAFIYQAQGQMLFDFETNTTSGGFGSWGSAAFTQIANPDASGINTSANVGEFSHDGTGGFVGIESDGSFDNINFNTTPTIKLKVWVDEPVAFICKLQNNPDWGQNTELTYQISQAETSQWIELSFNFSNVTATNFNRIVLYFDGANSIPSGAGHKYYFDDIEKSSVLLSPTCTDGIQNGDETDIDCGGTTCNPCPQKLTNFNFNFDTDTPLQAAESATFNDDAINTVTDGINSSANVGEITGINASWWSQLRYQFDDGIDLSTLDRGFSVKVKGPRALAVTIKIEGSEEHAEIANYTTAGVWQTLTFDFSAYSSTSNTKICMFFGIQEDATAFPDANDNVFQIDDYVFGAFASLGVEDLKIEGLSVYPNPTTNSWNVSTNNVRIDSINVFNILGKRVISLKPNTMSATIDATNLTTGIYITKIRTELGTETKKLMKH